MSTEKSIDHEMMLGAWRPLKDEEKVDIRLILKIKGKSFVPVRAFKYNAIGWKPSGNNIDTSALTNVANTDSEQTLPITICPLITKGEDSDPKLNTPVGEVSILPKQIVNGTNSPLRPTETNTSKDRTGDITTSHWTRPRPSGGVRGPGRSQAKEIKK